MSFASSADLLSQELSCKWAPSGEGLEESIGQCVLAEKANGLSC